VNFSRSGISKREIIKKIGLKELTTGVRKIKHDLFTREEGGKCQRGTTEDGGLMCWRKKG